MVVLPGGGAIFQVIVERMTKEPTALAPSTNEDQCGCSDSVWIGGFMLSSLSFQQMWTSKGEYGIWPFNRPKVCL